MNFFGRLFDSPDLMWLHAASLSLIAAACCSIAFATIYVLRKRPLSRLGGVVAMFAAFLLACGTARAIEVWNVWHSAYFAQELFNAITAAISVWTAIALVRLAPAAIRMPTAGAEELARLNAELRRSNAELEQFAYIASHDLQEPLRMISSYLNLLERRYGAQLDGEASEFVHYAMEGSARMKEMIQDVLTFSRIGTQVVQLHEIAAEGSLSAALENLRAAIAERGAQIHSGSLPGVFADAGLLAQVFQNLIGNAIKFSSGTAPHIEIAAEEGPEEWIFSVRDHGIGIEPAHQERIFRIFERLNLREEYPGTGMGLAICKKIVERHGGRIWVESKPGQGSTFCFTIPAKVANISREIRWAKA